MDRSLASLLIAAGQAPSGDNTQPWRFVVDPESGTIALEEVATRDPSPMNAGGRMSRIAVGAALENLIRKAQSQGWGVKLERAVHPALAKIRLTETGGKVQPTEDALASRLTNRRLFDRRPVPGEILDRLIEATPDHDGVRTQWIVGADRLAKLARLIGRADAAMFGEASMRRAFLSKVRLDAAPGEAVADGLSPSSLELSDFDRWALRAIRRAPDRWLRLIGVSRVFAAKARRLVDSSSGLCLVMARNDGEETDLLVGRAMQRAWLTLTAEGLAVQPMMSLLVLRERVRARRRCLGRVPGPRHARGPSRRVPRPGSGARRLASGIPDAVRLRPGAKRTHRPSPHARGRALRHHIVLAESPYGGSLAPSEQGAA